MHFLSFSPSESCRLGVRAIDWEEAMLPVGEDRRKSDVVDVELLSDMRGYIDFVLLKCACHNNKTLRIIGVNAFTIFVTSGLTRSTGPVTSAGLDLFCWMGGNSVGKAPGLSTVWADCPSVKQNKKPPQKTPKKQKQKMCVIDCNKS